MATPMVTARRTPLGESSPFADQVEEDLLQRPKSTIAHGTTPFVSPDEDVKAFRGASPFSPNDPVQSPMSGFGTPITESIYEPGRYTTQMVSPGASPVGSEASPAYSPVTDADEADESAGAIRAGIVTPPVDHRTMSSAETVATSERTAARTLRTRTSLHGLSSTHYTASPSAYSPAYGSSQIGGYSAFSSSGFSPAYTTHMTPRYSPYSPGYLPTTSQAT